MPIEVVSEYQQPEDKPKAVSVWESRIAHAQTYDGALVQLVYQQLVETRKLRMLVIGLVSLLVVGVAISLTGMLLIANASSVAG